MDSPESCENASFDDSDCKSMSDIVESTVNDSKKDKLCLVCGDKALGYNFNAVSCESCKAFFRRNAHKTLRGRCEGKCNVNVESRAFCKRCRLAKCFSVGMRKEMILNDEQKEMRKQKIIFNKLRRQGQMPPQDTYSSSPRDLDPTSTVTSDCRTSKLGSLKLQGLFRKRENSLSQGSSSPSSSPGSGKELLCPSWLESQEQVAEVLSQIDDKHRHLIEEVQFAMEESSFLATTSTSLKALPTNPTEFINVAECFVRKLIKVAKHILAFRTLNKDDQIALLKGAVVDIMMLRSAVNYNPFTETWSLSTLECLTRRPSVDAECGTSMDVSDSASSSQARLSAELLKKGSPETRTCS
ncbi:hypothetical protein C0Q70_12958 [Pomacea canaliculata]|uniref:Nuclear receptor domain-containing protein n=1 Tax=Pomacea canaliculata TaxID=400727 RepID=A0A2T7P2X6_POMCA|nr:hypothetical protein C0Q70_12958 [Pomacea canaliculata]